MPRGCLCCGCLRCGSLQLYCLPHGCLQLGCSQRSCLQVCCSFAGSLRSCVGIVFLITSPWVHPELVGTARVWLICPPHRGGVGFYNYTTREWLKGCVGKACESCGDCLVYSRDNGNVECSITAQRLGNNEAHHLGSICGYCVDCNCSVGNRAYTILCLSHKSKKAKK